MLLASYDLIRHQERTEEDQRLLRERYGTTTSIDPQVELNERLERLYSAAAFDWEQEGKRLLDFFHNAQYTEDEVSVLKARRQAPVPINVIYPATEQAVAMLTTNKPRFQTTAREDSDRETAKAISDLLSYVWEISDASSHLKTVCYDYYVVGRGVLMAYIDPSGDYGRGEVRISEVPWDCVKVDPNSTDKLWRDAAHLVVSRVYTRERIESMWPGAAPILALAETGVVHTIGGTDMVRDQAQHIGQSEDAFSEHEKYRVIERFTKVKVPYHHTLDKSTGYENVHLPEEHERYLAEPAFYITSAEGDQQVITDNKAVEEIASLIPASVQVEENVWVYQPPPQVDPASGEEVLGEAMGIELIDHKRLITDGVIVVREVLLDRVQLVISIGQVLFWSGYLPTSHYPLVPLNNRHSRNPYPMSDVSFVKGMQQSLNKLHMQIIANVSTANNAKLVVPRGGVDRSMLEQELAKAGTAIIEVDFSAGTPFPLQVPPLDQALFAHAGNLTYQIEKTLGLFSTMQGDPTQAPATYKGTLAIDEFGQRRMRSKVDDIEQMLTQLGRVVLDYVQYTYTEEKTVRLLQPNNIVKETVVNQLTYDDLGKETGRIKDITVGGYDLVVLAGSTLPSNRWALSEYYMELFNLGLIDQVEALKKSEMVDVEGVLERAGYIAKLEGALAQAEEKIKDLKGDLQTARRQEVNALKRQEIEKWRGDLAGPAEQAKQASALYRARLQDQLKQQALESPDQLNGRG